MRQGWRARGFESCGIRSQGFSRLILRRKSLAGPFHSRWAPEQAKKAGRETQRLETLESYEDLCENPMNVPGGRILG
jgi:hypothetical protein